MKYTACGDYWRKQIYALKKKPGLIKTFSYAFESFWN
jgi:hypothetical protein